MRRVLPIGTPDFDYLLGSIKLDRRQMFENSRTEIPSGTD